MSDVDFDRPAPNDNLEVTEVEDGLVIYHPDPERVHVLNQTAAFIFEFCTGDRTIEDIAEEMRVAFGLADTPQDAVMECVIELRALNVLR